MFDDHDEQTTVSRTFAAVFALALILTPVAVFADEAFVAVDNHVPAFSELDADGDGLISQQEAQAHPALAAVFDEADANNDGALDRSEFQKALQLIQRG